MDALNIVLGDAVTYDRILQRGFQDMQALPRLSPATLVTKDRVQHGQAGAVLAFLVQLPDGSVRTAHATVSVDALLASLSALRDRHGPGRAPA